MFIIRFSSSISNQLSTKKHCDGWVIKILKQTTTISFPADMCNGVGYRFLSIFMKRAGFKKLQNLVVTRIAMLSGEYYFLRLKTFITILPFLFTAKQFVYLCMFSVNIYIYKH